MLSSVESFARLLRRAGVRVSTAEVGDAARAIAAVGLFDPRVARAALRASLVKRAVDLPIFEDLFDLVFARGGELLSAARSNSVLSAAADRTTPELVGFLAERLREHAAELSPLARLLLGLSDADVGQLIGSAAGRVGLDAMTTRFQVGYYSYRLQRQMGVDAAVQSALAAVRASAGAAGAGQEITDEMVRIIQRNASGLRDAIRDHAAAQAERQRVASGDLALRASLVDRPLASLSPTEVRELRDEVRRLAEFLKARVRDRRKRARTGRLELGRTMRASLASDGVVFDLRWALRKRRKPRLLILCDVSDSVRYVTDFMLQLVYALVDCFDRVDAFAFVAEIGAVDGIFRDYDVDRAIDLVHRGAAVNLFANSDYGRVLQQFRSEHFGKLSSKTTVLVIGDGRSNYHPARAPIVGEMQRRARRVLWLCPESPATWGSGDSAMLEYEAQVERVVVATNLRTLRQVIGELIGVR